MSRAALQHAVRVAGAFALVAMLAGAPGSGRAQTPPLEPSPPASSGAPLEPQLLLYSDDPENVPADGLLFRSTATVAAGSAARAYLYHVLQDGGQRLYLVVETVGASSQVQVLGAAAAGDVKPMYVGHRVTVEYLRKRKAPASAVASAAAGAPLVLPVTPDAALWAGAAPGRPLVQAIYDLRVLAGDPVRLSVVAAHDGVDPLVAAAQPLPGDGYRRKGEFSLAGVPPVRLHFTVGDACDADRDCETFAAGMASFAERNGGRPLGGDYGVLRPVELTMANPTPAARDVYLYEQAGTAGVTTTIAFDGDAGPTEVACVLDTAGYFAVKRFTLAPRETRVVTGAYMTDGGSHFPLELGLTATPPASASDECGARAHPSSSAAGSG